MGDTDALRDKIAQAIAEIDPVMRYDSPLLTGRRALADRVADAVLPVVQAHTEAALKEQARMLVAVYVNSRRSAAQRHRRSLSDNKEQQQ